MYLSVPVIVFNIGQKKNTGMGLTDMETFSFKNFKDWKTGERVINYSICYHLLLSLSHVLHFLFFLWKKYKLLYQEKVPLD